MLPNEKLSRRDAEHAEKIFGTAEFPALMCLAEAEAQWVQGKNAKQLLRQ
jgi:hypothetical protein